MLKDSDIELGVLYADGGMVELWRTEGETNLASNHVTLVVRISVQAVEESGHPHSSLVDN